MQSLKIARYNHFSDSKGRKKRFIFIGTHATFARSNSPEYPGGILDQVIGINRRNVFSLEEAQALLPVVFRITKVYSQKVEALIERLDALSGHNEPLVGSLESQVNHLIHEWQCKVQKLGALPKGLWLADFDSGDGYFCWKFPERSIEFWHRYTDGYSKRVSVVDKADPFQHQDCYRQKLMPSLPPHLPQTELSE